MFKPNPVLIFAPGLLLITLIACGGDDPAPAAVPPVSLAEGVHAEPGSEEAMIINLAERAISSLRSRDAEALRAECHPDLQAIVSVDELAVAIELDSNQPGYKQPINTSKHNWVINRIQNYGDSATINWDWREGDDVIELDNAQSVEKVGDKWYLTSRKGLCAGVGEFGDDGF